MIRCASHSQMTLDQLLVLREKTEKLSSLLSARLRNHLNTLYPLLAPKRVLGKYLGAKEAVPRAEEAYAQIADKYKDVAGSPFDVRADLDEQALAAMEHGIDIYPWEYTHQVNGKAITITSPVRWVVTYKSDLSLAQIRTLTTTAAEKKPLPIRQFLVNAIALQTVVARTAGLQQLLEDLRYQIKVEPGPGLGKLPLLTIGFPIESVRPADDLISSATRFSGVSAFIELVDASEANLPDSLKETADSILRG